MAYGILSTALTGVPDNIDLEKANLYRTSDGVGFGELLGDFRDMARSFAGFNWPNHQDFAAVLNLCCHTSTDNVLTFRQGSIGWQAATEEMLGDIPRQHRTVAGGEIPFVQRMAGIGYTGESLRPGVGRVKSADIASDFAAIMDGAVEEVRKQFLTCISTKATRTVYGSTTGYVAGWVGATSQAFEPTPYGGRTFSSHTHFLGDADGGYADSANGRRSLFNAAWLHFREHGITSSRDNWIIMFHGDDTYADVIADAQYVAKSVVGVSPASTSTTVTDVPEWAHGKLKDSNIVCCQLPGLPDNTFSWVKSYGSGNLRNPIRLLYPADRGFGPTLVDFDSNTVIGAKTIADLVSCVQFGFGCANPLLGAAGAIGNSGTWSDPTIT